MSCVSGSISGRTTAVTAFHQHAVDHQQQGLLETLKQLMKQLRSVDMNNKRKSVTTDMLCLMNQRINYISITLRSYNNNGTYYEMYTFFQAA